MALFDRPPPFWALALRRWLSDRATVRWPPPCATVLFLALLRLEEPRTLCFFTSRAGFGAVIALLGFAAATCVPGRLCAGLAASALAELGCAWRLRPRPGDVGAPAGPRWRAFAPPVQAHRRAVSPTPARSRPRSRCRRPAPRPAAAPPDCRRSRAGPCAGGAGPAPGWLGVSAACRAAQPCSSRGSGPPPRAGQHVRRCSVGVDRPSPRAARPARPRALRALVGVIGPLLALLGQLVRALAGICLEVLEALVEFVHVVGDVVDIIRDVVPILVVVIPNRRHRRRRRR